MGAAASVAFLTASVHNASPEELSAMADTLSSEQKSQVRAALGAITGSIEDIEHNRPARPHSSGDSAHQFRRQSSYRSSWGDHQGSKFGDIKTSFFSERLAEDGFVFVPGVTDEATCNAVIQDYVTFFEGEPKFKAECQKLLVDGAPPTERLEAILLSLYEKFPLKELEDIYNLTLPPNVKELSESTRINTSSSIVDVVTQKGLGDMLQQVLGVGDIDQIDMVPVQQIRLKPPLKLLKEDTGKEHQSESKARASVGTTPWHQDRFAYAKSADGVPVITVWTALTKCPAEMGCLRVLKGSHKFGFQAHVPISETMPDECHIPKLTVDLLKQSHGLEEVVLEAQKGDMIFLHPEVIHCSNKNISSHCRVSMDLRFCPAGSAPPRPWFPTFNLGTINPEAYQAGWEAARRRLLQEKSQQPKDVNQSCGVARPVLLLSSVLPSEDLRAVGEAFHFRTFHTTELHDPQVNHTLKEALASDPMLLANTIVTSLTSIMGPYNRAFFDATEDSVLFRELLQPHFPGYFFMRAMDLSQVAPPPFDGGRKYICKPIVGYASLHVHLVSSIVEWNMLAQETRGMGVEFIVEECMEGLAFLAVDCLSIPSSHGKPRLFKAVNVYQRFDRGVQEELNCTNARVHAEYGVQLESFMNKVLDSLPLPPFESVIFNMEVIVLNDGNFFPVEINPFRWDGMAAMQAMFKGTNPYGALVVNGFDPNAHLPQNTDFAVVYVRESEQMPATSEGVAAYKVEVTTAILEALPKSASVVADVVRTVAIDASKCGGIMEARVVRI